MRSFGHTLRAYYALTKPGIIRGNLLMVTAGFFLAEKGRLDWMLFLEVVAGTSLIIASACVFNNYIDRSVDVKMERTRKRALVTGRISSKRAILFACILGIAGFFILSYTNLLTVMIGLTAYVFYVVIYAAAKRASYHGTLVGAIPGALPPVAGYVAVTGSIDLAAIILFFILVLWQMPHFYAIAMYRRKDYASAGIPVISVVKGAYQTKRAIMWYIFGFLLISSTLFITGYVGITYLVIMTITGGLWFVAGLRGFTSHTDEKWARKMFFVSLIVSLVLSVMITFDNILA